MAANPVSPELTLASASPRRAELLRQIGVRFRQRPVPLDETPGPGEAPVDYVMRLAREKAAAAVALDPSLPVLGSDTTVVLDGVPMGKPRDEADAVAMLLALSGRRHLVLTAVAVADRERCETRLSQTGVAFAELDEAHCRRYWRSGEPADKAGAYAVQGLGAAFVRAIDGSYSGVVGLPLAETVELLESFNISYWNKRTD